MSESDRPAIRTSHQSPRRSDRLSFTPSRMREHNTSSPLTNARRLTSSPSARRSFNSPHSSHSIHTDSHPSRYDDDDDDDDVDDGEFIAHDTENIERAMDDVFGKPLAKSDSLHFPDLDDFDDEAYADAFAEEETLVHDPVEEEKRRLFLLQSFHPEGMAGDDDIAMLSDSMLDDDPLSPESTTLDDQDVRSSTKRVFDKALEMIMYCFFMCLWPVMQVAVNIIEFVIATVDILTKPLRALFRLAGYDTPPQRLFVSFVAWTLSATAVLYVAALLVSSSQTSSQLPILRAVSSYHASTFGSLRSWVGTHSEDTSHLVHRLQTLEKSLSALSERLTDLPKATPAADADVSAQIAELRQWQQQEQLKLDKLTHAAQNKDTSELADRLQTLETSLTALSKRIADRPAAAPLSDPELAAQLAELWQMQKKEHKLDDTTNMHAVSALIDSALDRYHQDVIALPDYAAQSRGGRIIPRLTSPSFIRYPKNQVARLVAKALGLGAVPKSPVIALMPGTHVGECWPMQGSNGTMGILLSEPVAVQSVSIEHPGRDVLNDLRGAPKDMEVWGLKRAPSSLLTSPWLHQDDGNAVFLGTIQYNIKQPKSIQTFDLTAHRFVVFESVVFRILSNWGSDDYTCLYRVRVHGIPAEHNRPTQSPPPSSPL